MHCVWHRIFSWCKWWVWWQSFHLGRTRELSELHACVCVYTQTESFRGWLFCGENKTERLSKQLWTIIYRNALSSVLMTPCSLALSGVVGICLNIHFLPDKQNQGGKFRGTHISGIQSLIPRGKEMFPLPPVDFLIISWKCSAGYWAVYAVFFPMKYNVPERSVTSLWNLGSQFLLPPAFSSLVASLHPLWMHKGVICFLCQGVTAARHPSESGEGPRTTEVSLGPSCLPEKGHLLCKQDSPLCLEWHLRTSKKPCHRSNSKYRTGGQHGGIGSCSLGAFGGKDLLEAWIFVTFIASRIIMIFIIFSMLKWII